ncbi:protein rep [Adlercreutzia sp. ZJ242]|uniref:protein rep n=1 Tax=Adlercreutzia sp. ZJ242 TaxID=2709409 RepID=UPI0013EC77C9|nr:protein rep [Adlercreutzia sp. ZJ242]
MSESIRTATAEPQRGSLIPLRTYEPPQVSERAEHRRERYRRRAVAQRREIRQARAAADLDPDGKDGFAKPSRRVWCGRARTFGSVAVKVRHDEGGSHAHFSGVQHCGSVWACPVCAPIIRRERADEITEGARRHIAMGGGIAMVTFTIRHSRADGLSDSMQVLADAYSDMSRSRAFRGWKAERGMIGHITSTEITYGVNGWHPHRHVLMLFSRPVSHEQERVLQGELFAMWSHAVERSGGETVSREAFDVRAVTSGEEQVASYVTKTVKGVEGIGKEVSLADVKAGRASGSINPFQLLDVETLDAERLWNEYADATKGRSAIRWSRGLRDALGMGREKTDQEIVDEMERIGEIQLLIAPSLFNRSVRSYRSACLILEAAERGDYGYIRRTLGGSGYTITLPDGHTVAMMCDYMTEAA